MKEIVIKVLSFILRFLWEFAWIIGTVFFMLAYTASVLAPQGKLLTIDYLYLSLFMTMHGFLGLYLFKNWAKNRKNRK